jgi:hypothetical protein
MDKHNTAIQDPLPSQVFIEKTIGTTKYYLIFQAGP